MNPVFSILIGGILPFGVVFIELFFILTSIWLHQFYYIFGFLFIVFLILLVTFAEITIVLCYFQLCSEDYLWWWRSYLTSGSSSFYLFLYAAISERGKALLECDNAIAALQYRESVVSIQRGQNAWITPQIVHLMELKVLTTPGKYT